MEYCMTPSTSIYMWKEERPEKSGMATEIVKIWYYLWKSILKTNFYISPHDSPGSNFISQNFQKKSA